MKKIKTFKYQGVGNDFVIIDSRTKDYELSEKEIEFLCNRKFGIGADGLILLKNHPKFDFEMQYFNSDGKESTMCGNGGRCLVSFAHSCGIFQKKCTFLAIDGEHEAEMIGDLVCLKMINIDEIYHHNSDFILNTGSPHYVQIHESIDELNVPLLGKIIRNSEEFVKEGINVNFVEKINNYSIKVRTFERGVEDETLSCGTGVTASAVVMMLKNNCNSIQISTLGGNLLVEAERKENKFFNIYLTGPAKMVFQTEIEINVQNYNYL